MTAQQTWVVDPNGGGNFTDLTVAIAAASPGDTLRIRSGIFPLTYTLDKALHIVGDPVGRPIVERFHQLAAPAGPSASFRNLTINNLDLRIPTVVEDVHSLTVHASSTTVSLLDCVLGGTTNPYWPTRAAIATHQSHIAVHRCTIKGNAPFSIMTRFCNAYRGLAAQLQGGTATFSDCAIDGANAGLVLCGSMAPPGPAIEAWGCHARLRSCTLRGGADVAGARTDPLIVFSNAIVNLDPNVVTVPATTGGVIQFLPGTDATSAAPGQVIPCAAIADPSQPAVLVAGIGLRSPTTTIYGDAWVDPAANVILRIGFTNSVGRMAAAIGLPSTAPFGLPITVQSVIVDTGSGDLVAGAPVIVQVL